MGGGGIKGIKAEYKGVGQGAWGIYVVGWKLGYGNTVQENKSGGPCIPLKKHFDKITLANTGYLWAD